MENREYQYHSKVEKRVFIINNSSHDFEPAKKFGKLIFLSEGRYSRYDVNAIYREFDDKLSTSSPGDYLLLTGLPIMQGVAMMIMAIKHGRVNLLQFRQKEDRSFYLERNIVIDQDQPIPFQNIKVDMIKDPKPMTMEDLKVEKK